MEAKPGTEAQSAGIAPGSAAPAPLASFGVLPGAQSAGLSMPLPSSMGEGQFPIPPLHYGTMGLFPGFNLAFNIFHTPEALNMLGAGIPSHGQQPASLLGGSVGGVHGGCGLGFVDVADPRAPRQGPPHAATGPRPRCLSFVGCTGAGAIGGPREPIPAQIAFYRRFGR